MTLFAIATALAAMFLLGQRAGRRNERAEIFRKYGVHSGSELKKLRLQQFERSLGAARMHADPDSAPRISKAAIRR